MKLRNFHCIIVFPPLSWLSNTCTWLWRSAFVACCRLVNEDNFPLIIVEISSFSYLWIWYLKALFLHVACCQLLNEDGWFHFDHCQDKELQLPSYLILKRTVLACIWYVIFVCLSCLEHCLCEFWILYSFEKEAGKFNCMF